MSYFFLHTNADYIHECTLNVTLYRSAGVNA